MELIDLLFFPSVVMAGIVLWAFATYDKKVAAEHIDASSLTAKQLKTCSTQSRISWRK